jgi:hypothetical protein
LDTYDFIPIFADMPRAGAANIGAGRGAGQDALDLSICIAILKKALVIIPIIIMILIYLISSQIPKHNKDKDVTNIVITGLNNSSKLEQQNNITIFEENNSWLDHDQGQNLTFKSEEEMTTSISRGGQQQRRRKKTA